MASTSWGERGGEGRKPYEAISLADSDTEKEEGQLEDAPPNI